MNEKKTRVPGTEPLPDGTYYVGDLIGLRALDETGAFVGTVTGVLMTKQQCLEIAAGMTPDDLAELERKRVEAQAEADEKIREFERKIRENPGSVPNPEKALRAKKKKWNAAVPKPKTFLVPFVSAYVREVEPENGTLRLTDVNGLMDI
jgi:ribosomal 30S subunit maturation factor RimM